MVTMQLRITNIPGRIGITRHDALLSIRQPRPEVEYRTTPPETNIQFKHARIKIDQSQCFSEAGLKDVFELTQDFAREGREAALEAIGRIGDEGNQMAAIERKGDPIVEIATAKALPPPADFNIKFIPQSRPKIEVEEGLSFEPVMGRVEIGVKVNPPRIDVTYPHPKGAEIYLLQKPEFRFEFVGKNIDISG